MSSDNNFENGLSNIKKLKKAGPKLKLVVADKPESLTARSGNPLDINNVTEKSISQAQQECQETGSNVINLFTGRATLADHVAPRVVRIVPETYGTRMLYANLDQPERLVAVPLLCWALDEKGEYYGLVPWLDEILPCSEVAEKYSVSWEGYYRPDCDEIFFEAGEEVRAQLTLSARYDTFTGRYVETGLDQPRSVIQEIADPVGTHALLLNEASDSMLLTSVVSWVLDEDGQLHGMLADDDAIEKLPVLPGDNCLFNADQAENFRCFFQRDIAEQIRTQHPETLEAIEHLFAN